ncbi:MAG: primosomal protein N' [Clostridia bacterium]|nr:primosomal protein N' [Clostridia bacterium]
MEKVYAFVRILNATLRYDREYTYYIRPEMRNKVSPGVMCAVPYGNSNKLRTGVITGVTDECDYSQVKPIAEVFEYPVPLNEETLGLCRFMSERCFCTFGAAARTVLPAGQEIENCVFFETLEYDKSRLNDKGGFIYDYLREKGKTKESALVAEFGEEVSVLLRSLTSLGALAMTTETRKKVNEKKTVLYRLAASDEAAYAVENPESLRSEKQRLIVDFLKDGGVIGALEAEELFGTGRSVLTGLCRSNIIEKYERADERIYYISDPRTVPDVSKLPLSQGQEEAFAKIASLMESGEPKAALLYGVTGSGKTRVIIEACKKAVSSGRSAIVLVPEIGLTAQAVDIFRRTFGERLAVLHSMLSVGERLDTCRKILSGGVDVVIGTRSAVFAPLKNLGLIAIDEEQEHTYKSENTPKYHARDIARYRCAYNNCLMLLASATPSVESYYKAEQGIYELIKLPSRVGESVMPECRVADIRRDARSENGKIISEQLAHELERMAEEGRQSILFVNRRGYNSHLSCMKCGHVFTCPNCSVSLTYHAYGDSVKRNKLVCHYCGYVMNKPEKCPECGSEHIGHSGFGTQKLQEELETDFPSLSCVRMDADTTGEKHSHEQIIRAFAQGEYDVLFGTQMIAKGLDFPKVGLVGVVSADASLYMNDFRAGERTFSLFTQLAGRSGRSGEKGLALFQTYNPENEVLRLSMTQDYEAFYKTESRLRKAVVFPPFCDIAVFTFSAETESDANSAAEAMSGVIARIHTEKYASLPMVKLGPYREGVFRLRNKYRQRIIIKYKDRSASRAFLAEAFAEINKLIPKTVRADLDINPSAI